MYFLAYVDIDMYAQCLQRLGFDILDMGTLLYVCAVMSGQLVCECLAINHAS